MEGPQVDDLGAVTVFFVRALCLLVSIGSAGASLYLLKKNGLLVMPTKTEDSEIEASGETAYAGSKMDSETSVV